MYLSQLPPHPSAFPFPPPKEPSLTMASTSTLDKYEPIFAGPLTTPFSQPSYCNNVVMSLATGADWGLGPRVTRFELVRDVTCGPSGDAVLASECFPPVTGPFLSKSFSNFVYSPGAACPIGYTHSPGAERQQYTTCCPNSYSEFALGRCSGPVQAPSSRRDSTTTVYRCNSGGGSLPTPVAATYTGGSQGAVGLIIDTTATVVYTSVFPHALRLTGITPMTIWPQNIVASQTAVTSQTSVATGNNGKGLSGGAIGGIVAGVLLLIVAAIGVFLLRRRKRRLAPGIGASEASAPATGLDASEKPELEGNTGITYGTLQYHNNELDATNKPKEIPLGPPELDATAVPLAFQNEGLPEMAESRLNSPGPPRNVPELQSTHVSEMQDTNSLVSPYEFSHHSAPIPDHWAWTPSEQQPHSVSPPASRQTYELSHEQQPQDISPTAHTQTYEISPTSPIAHSQSYELPPASPVSRKPLPSAELSGSSTYAREPDATSGECARLAELAASKAKVEERIARLRQIEELEDERRKLEDEIGRVGRRR
ncbi:hypothetical protein CC86DRAFT_427200 [Ophiobolus disseminans]|uniref:Uncharacterized protein n=1 Tax=Ophiobolus disseminans TaxID=1469910 RepID=A0A6A6ZJA2_9PLEO|nr:hypothetical protein CC86DRAFT_427200 [Ophiobolus disseminans]